MSYLLGGPLAPIGWNVGLVEAPLAPVIQEMLAWRRSRQEDVVVSPLTTAYPACLHALEPLETPWSRALYLDHGGRWTVMLNNSVDAADPAGLVSMLGRRLGTIAVAVAHRPLTLFGDALDEFQVYGSDGPPPMHLLRSVMSRSDGGEWSWRDSGSPLPFEDTTRYEHPEIAERLDRDVIAGYLARLGVAIDDDASFRAGVLVRQTAEWERQTLTLDQARAQWGMF